MPRYDTNIQIVRRDSKTLQFNVFEEGILDLVYSVSPRRVYGTSVIFTLNDISKLNPPAGALDYITAIGSMFKIASTDISIFDMLASYKAGDNIGFGIDSHHAPYAFDDNTTFTESLLMENIICDDDDEGVEYFNLISGKTEDTIIFDLDGLHTLTDTLIVMDEIPIVMLN